MLVCVDCGGSFDSWRDLSWHQMYGACATPTLAGGQHGWPTSLLGGVPVDPEVIARVVHEANRGLQEALGDPHPSPPYDDAPDWQLMPLREGVARALDGIGPAEHHEAWLADKFARGWTYGPVKDAEARTHPNLLPYDDLPPEQRAKNDLFIAIVGALR